MKMNYNLFPEFIKLANELEVDTIFFSPLVVAGNAEKNLNLVRYSNRDYLVTIEQNLEYLKNNNLSFGKLKVQINDIRFPYTQYIKKKYNIELPTDPYRCGGGISYGYIRSDGRLFPCRALTGDDPDVEDFFKDIDCTKNSLLKFDFYEIWNSDPFLKLFELIYNDETYINYIPCKTCEFLEREICKPCPLGIFQKNSKNPEIYRCVLNIDEKS
jgi:MoaA/NifB/PqqE/SkfB family radical SAM enzyme